MESTNQTLAHYGVKGMKWGVRKAQKEYAELDRRKAAYKKAKKAYNKAYNQAAGIRNYGSFSPIKKHRVASQKRWEKALDKGQALNEAKKAYKDQKKNVHKNTTLGQKIGRGAKAIGPALKVVGSMYVADVMTTGGAVTRASVKVGKAAVKSTMNKIGDQVFDYTLMDKDGKPIKRYN